MHLWIVTIGSSDVQLISDKANQAKGRTEKQRSDKVWSYWYTDDLRADCYDIPFEPKQLFKDKEESYRIAPRILGRVYQASDESRQHEILDYLSFPLLDNFVQALKDYPAPEAIAVLLTDQSTIFGSDRQRKLNSPYWQDTCELQPILQDYFAEKFPGAACEFISLIPNSEAESLDNWNAVLDLVRGKFRSLTIADQPIQVNPGKNVYVSHQAGTPAISSAVQFISLSRFRDNVQFLVSNEYDRQTCTIPRSNYLRELQRQEAIALLERRDYGGVRDVLGLTAITPGNSSEKRAKYLLEAGNQWNFAEFQKFKKILVDRKLISGVKFPWWRLGYESAYLSVIRLTKQENTVEALFHSFRAIEGSISRWAQDKYRSHIEVDPQYGPQIKLSIQRELPGYLNALSESMQDNFQRKGRIGLYGVQLYELLKEARSDWQIDHHIKVVWETTKNQRNELFHRIEGLQTVEVYQAWGTNTVEEWKAKVLGCLNFIAKDDLPQKFESLEEASLMTEVHQELERAIADL
uniref:Uncharacterized protein n=1 Tax=Cyanothece sp. (strain PCC 7425 / ATCC 29141) TaxID=395961 RepID=B8HYU6_CYAP4